MRKCATCRFFVPGNRYPDFERRGVCARIHGTTMPARDVMIRPAGDSWLEVDRYAFGCVLHEDAGRAALQPQEAT